jgi:hypothetical protein
MQNEGSANVQEPSQPWREFREGVRPRQDATCAAPVSNELQDWRANGSRAYEVPLVNANEDLASLLALADLVHRVALALPHDGGANDRERLFDKLANGVSLARCENEVVRSVLLEHAPHAFDVVASVSPVALGVEVAEVL